MKRLSALAVVCSLFTGLFSLAAEAQELPAPTVAQDRSVESVVLDGSKFPDWSAGPEVSVREPATASTSDCPSDATGNHNCSQRSRISNPREGVGVDRLVGYRWESGRFLEIPLQVDERFTRYISNLASNAGPGGVGFGMYSGTDPLLSYVYDREGYRFTENVPDDPATAIDERCIATMKPGDGPEQDPTKGLDNNDELAFLFRDTGVAQAPAGAALPRGIQEMRAVAIADPSASTSDPRYAYVGLASPTDGATPTFNKDNGYMRYVRDASADLYKESSDNYGNAPSGPHCNDDGVVLTDGSGNPTIESRRPRDTAWVFSPRYSVRYGGRWIISGFNVRDGNHREPGNDVSDYGPPLVDRWKGRAYAQKPGDKTPCCGFQTEENSWEKASVLLGERMGPVRVIRASWGANSGTNTVKQEIFYPDVVVQQTYLRVHTMPPLGSVFGYWDHTGGVVTKYYNERHPEGVVVDGKNDDLGNLYYNVGGRDIRHNNEPLLPGADPTCSVFCSEFDVTDPTHNGTSQLGWEQVGGDYGSMVFSTTLENVTPGAAQSIFVFPYYRDDSCLDDGTGVSPGPKRAPAPCWTWDPENPEVPGPTSNWRQGLIGAHGTQIYITAETDNAFTTLPVTELDGRTRMVVLPPSVQGNVGDEHGKSDDFPLQTVVTPFTGSAPTKDSTTLEFTDSSDASAAIGETATLEAKLTAGNTPLADASVEFTFQGEPYEAATDERGVASTSVLVEGPAGDHMARADFAGDDERQPSSATSTFAVEKRKTFIAFTDDSDTSGDVGDSATFVGQLKDGDEPVANAPVTFDFQEERYTATTNDEGVATGKVTVAGPPDDYPVSVGFAGDDARQESSDEATFVVTEVELAKTSLAFTGASDTSGHVGGLARFEALLEDPDGPVAGAQIEFSFQDGTYQATTDANGIASVETPIAGPAGDDELEADFSGDATRAPSTAQPTTFTVTKAASEIHFKAFTKGDGKKRRTVVDVLLTDARTRAGLADRVVSVYVNGKLAATVETNDDGKARAVLSDRAPKGKTFRVEFGGDEQYEGSSAEGLYGKKGATG